MTVKPITTGDLFQGGRIEAFDPNTGPSFLRYVEAIFALADPLEFNFPNAQATGQTFGIVRSVFINNSDNDYDVTVLVAGTRQQFVAYAGSQGFYKIDAQMGSTILASTAGDSTGPVEFIFYNTPQTPFVWYEKNPNTISAAVTIADGADVALGDTSDAAETDSTQAGTVIAFLKGAVQWLDDIFAAMASITANTDAYSYDNISGAATTVVKGTPGIIAGISVNTGAVGTATIYDNTVGAGAIIAVVDTTLINHISFAGGNGIEALTGITVVTTGASDITVSYR